MQDEITIDQKLKCGKGLKYLKKYRSKKKPSRNHSTGSHSRGNNCKTESDFESFDSDNSDQYSIQ